METLPRLDIDALFAGPGGKLMGIILIAVLVAIHAYGPLTQAFSRLKGLRSSGE